MGRVSVVAAAGAVVLAVAATAWAQSLPPHRGPYTRMHREEVSVDFPAIASLATEIVTVAMPGAVVGDAVLCNASESLGDTVMLGTCTVLANDTVSIKAGNFKSTGAVDPPAQVMHFTLFKKAW